jgi:hypothetical protein
LRSSYEKQTNLRWLEAEKEESSKRAFVNAVTSTVTPSESQLLGLAINIRHQQSETVGSISSNSRTLAEAEPPSSLSGFNMLAKLFDEIMKSLNNVRQPVQHPSRYPSVYAQPVAAPSKFFR